MARRVKIGGDERETSASPSKTKTLSNVSLDSGDAIGGGFVLNLSSNNRDTRELTQEGVLEAYHTSPPLHMAVSAIARTVGEVTYTWADDREPGTFRLDRPNRWHQSAEYFGLCAAYLKLTGEYVAIRKDGKDGAELWPMPPHLVEEPETPSGKWQIEGGAVSGLSKNEYERDELVILKEPSLLDPFMHGRGAGQAAGYDVDIDQAAAEHTAAYMENHARPDAIIGIDGVSPDDLDRFRDSMRKKHGGPGNAGKIEAFGESSITVESLMQSFDELGTPELRKASERICRQLFGVLPSVVGDVEDTNRATAEVEEYLFKKNVVKPLVDKIVEGHNAQFISDDIGEQYAITTGQIVPANTDRRLEYAKEHPGAVYANESRRWLGLEAADELEGQTLADVQPSPDTAIKSRAASGSKGGARKKRPPQSVVAKAVDDPRIRQVLEAVDAEDMNDLRGRFEEAFRDEAQETIQGLGESFGGGVLDDAVAAKVDERFEWVLDEIADETRLQIRQEIEEGLDVGENPREVGERIRSKFDDDFAEWRTELIARTEMLSASNAGTWTAHRESDVVTMRSWLSTRDGNVRPAHRRLDEQTSKDPIGVEQPFTADGAQAMHPGDFGVARLDCNCRCTTVAEFPDRNRSFTERTKIWRAFVKRLDAQEQRTAEVVRRSFRAQRDKVLAEFADAFDIELEAVA